MSDDKFETVTCCSCGVEFGMTPEYQKFRRRDHKMFLCPNGHSQSYTEPAEDPKDAEITVLKARVVDLQDKADKLALVIAELDIWKPRLLEEKSNE